ncbi:unnamed protein product, partial [Rotaria sp. Silwood1]
ECVASRDVALELASALMALGLINTYVLALI